MRSQPYILSFLPVFFFFTFYSNWFIISLVNFTLLAFCYHMSSGVCHLLWDLGSFLELSEVYTFEIIMLFSAIFFSFIEYYPTTLVKWPNTLLNLN